MGLIIRSSAIHAAGCYTTTPIRKGQRVAEYTGHRLTKAEADTAYEESPITYLFGLGDGTIVIDGHSTAMFINHSCDANCETREARNHVWIVAIRDIEAGEEITYDYCLYDGGDDEARCNCGAAQCRGTMYSPEEMKRRKRAAGRAVALKQGKRREAAKV
jgi:SET domain-containing protein